MPHDADLSVPHLRARALRVAFGRVDPDNLPPDLHISKTVKRRLLLTIGKCKVF
jgi:hypothetical protein